MKTLILLRDLPENDRQTTGQLFVLDENAQVIFSCYTLELPWRDNQKSISCIPEGTYPIVPRRSNRFRDHLHVLDVPNRTYILIHEANFVNQLRGCIAVGKERRDLNGDGLRDVVSSNMTKKEITKLITSASQIIISTNQTRYGNLRTN
jgi:hypothetical protein